MRFFSRFKKKKENSVEHDYQKMFGNELDSFAKESFGTDLSKDSKVGVDIVIEKLRSNSIPDCSEHAYNKYLYGEKLYKEGNVEESAVVLREAIKLGNHSPEVYKRLAIIYRKQKKYESELEIIEKALRLYEGKEDVKTSFRDLSKRKIRVLELMNKN